MKDRPDNHLNIRTVVMEDKHLIYRGVIATIGGGATIRKLSNRKLKGPILPLLLPNIYVHPINNRLYQFPSVTNR